MILRPFFRPYVLSSGPRTYLHFRAQPASEGSGFTRRLMAKPNLIFAASLSSSTVCTCISLWSRKRAPSRSRSCRSLAAPGQGNKPRAQVRFVPSGSIASFHPLPSLLVRPEQRTSRDGSGWSVSCQQPHARRYAPDFCHEAEVLEVAPKYGDSFLACGHRIGRGTIFFEGSERRGRSRTHWQDEMVVGQCDREQRCFEKQTSQSSN